VCAVSTASRNVSAFQAGLAFKAVNGQSLYGQSQAQTQRPAQGGQPENF
jgi:hypothetical protein